MTVSVLLIAFHGDRWLPDCLSTLASASSGRSHLILVDNSGNSIIPSLDLSAFDAEVLHTGQPMGFAEANNFGLVHATHLEDHILFLNQDTVSTPGWIDTCCAMIAQQPDIAALTPLTRNYTLEDWEKYFLECALLSDSFAQAIGAEMSLKGFHETPVIPAAAMLVRRDALISSGPFDPIYESYYEDYDLCFRLRRTGGRVGVCGDAVLGHFSGSASQSPAAERRRARWVSRNQVIYTARTSAAARWSYFLCHFLLEFPRGLLRSLLRRPGAKPLAPYLSAHASLLALLPRLISVRRDNQAWQAYLNTIHWPARSSS